MPTRNKSPQTRSDQRRAAVGLDDLVPIDVPLDEHCGEGGSGETDWLVRVHWQVSAERVVPVGMTLINTTGQPVTAEQWRRVKPAEVLRASRDLVEAAALLGSMTSERETALHLLGLVTAKSDDRSGYGEDHYRAVAAAYTWAVDSGDKAPVQAVRRRFREAYPGLKESTVKGWIRTAKTKGLITETARRKRKGDQT